MILSTIFMVEIRLLMTSQPHLFLLEARTRTVGIKVWAQLLLPAESQSDDFSFLNSDTLLPQKRKHPTQPSRCLHILWISETLLFGNFFCTDFVHSLKWQTFHTRSFPPIWTCTQELPSSGFSIVNLTCSDSWHAWKVTEKLSQNLRFFFFFLMLGL